MSFTELHFHLLPGVDDGPDSLDESIELAAAAADEGTRTIVATPHVNHNCVSDVSVLPEMVDEVRAALRRAEIPIEVHCGAELAHTRVGSLSQADLELIAHGPRGRRWLLLEAPLAGILEDYTAAAEELRERGFAVVVAHPERALSQTPGAWRVFERELAAGSGVQVNCWSLAGLYGEQVRLDALRVIAAAPRAVVASDAHGSSRMPCLTLGLDALRSADERDPVRRAASLPAALLQHGLRAVSLVL